jgi:hypothetical protein
MIVERLKIGIIQDPRLHIEGRLREEPHKQIERAIELTNKTIKAGDVVSG